jgi:protein-S-isoprenylcysteine O-methyltransferase Ste14
MNMIKKLGLVILSPLFIFLLFATAFDIGFVHTVTHPATVKKLVSESGLYNSLVPNVLQQTKTISTPVGDISTADPAIQSAVTSAITPQTVQQNTEAAIDNIYQWLNGAISQPSFDINFASSKTSLADNISNIVQQRAAALPACSNAQSLAIIQSGSFDVVNASCLPRGVTAASAAGLVRTSLLGSNDLLDKASVSANSFKGSDNQSFFQSDKAKQVPRVYQRAKTTPLILSLLTVLCGAGIVLLSSTWQKGLRHIGINLVVIGVVMLVFSWALNRAVSTKIAPRITVDNAILQQDIRQLVTDVAQQVDRNYWFFGGLYTVLGAGSIAGAEIHKRRTASKVPNIDNSPKSSIKA